MKKNGFFIIELMFALLLIITCISFYVWYQWQSTAYLTGIQQRLTCMTMVSNCVEECMQGTLCQSSGQREIPHGKVWWQPYKEALIFDGLLAISSLERQVQLIEVGATWTHAGKEERYILYGLVKR
jgi:hypothetical protein